MGRSLRAKGVRALRMFDLFSGIGGFALAAEWVWKDELDIVGFCEIEKYAQKVLNKNFPQVPIYKDIRKLNGEDFKDIFLITGGFPCQDISIAGRGAGIEGKRSGLWTEMHRIISEVRPQYALIENVPMLIHRGLKRVLCDLAEIGYDAEWQIVGCDDVGGLHRRKRIWIVSYPKCVGRSKRGEVKEKPRGKTSSNKFDNSNKTQSGSSDVFDTEHTGRSETKEDRIHSKTKSEIAPWKELSVDESTGTNRLREKAVRRREISDSNGYREKRNKSKNGKGSGSLEGGKETTNTDKQGLQGFGGEHKLSESSREVKASRGGECSSRNHWATEPDVGRVAHGIPSRVDRLKGLGNAIVPQVAYIIMEKIKNATTKDK